MNSDLNDFRQRGKRSQNGGVLVLVAICLILFTSLAALAIDVGYLFVGRNELQNAADAAALAGASKLGNIYEKMAEDGESFVGYNVAGDDKKAIIAVAKEVAYQNKAANDGVFIDEAQGDIKIGVWDQDSDPKFTETDDRPDAVRVTTHRDTDNISDPRKKITTFFAAIFGIDSAPVSALATAELSPQSTTVSGELELPIGLSERWFYDEFGNPRDDFCGDIVKFSPPTDPDACAGWTSFDQKVANKNPINDILDGTYISNESGIGDLFKYTNGVAVSDLFKNLLMKFGTYPDSTKAYDVKSIYNRDTPDEFPERIDPEDYNAPDYRVPLCLYNSVVSECIATDVVPAGTAYDKSNPVEAHLRYPADGDPGNSGVFTGDLRYAHEWVTTVVVYSADDTKTEEDDPDLTGKSSCNPSGDIAIEGYVEVTLYDVGAPSNPYVFARVNCAKFSPGRSGGGKDYGVSGTIPGLVE